MFDDKDGGNVTTQHNAEQGLFAKESEEFNRTDYDYSAAKREKMREAFEGGSMNSQEFVDQYTGKHEPTKRENNKGKIVMNAELDHLVPVKDIHRQGGWIKDKQGRTELSSEKDNLHYTTHKTNRSKSDKAPEEAMSAENGFDKARIDPLLNEAKESLKEKLPDTSERLMYHGQELLNTGVQEAGRNAVRQAFGIVLHEYVNGSFHEIKVLFQDRHNEQSLIDRFIESNKRVMQRVISKLKAALEALVEGGIQGFVSNLLTFLINNLITTSKKIVALIRGSMQDLWKAIKMLVNPPEGMSGLEVARAVAKIIAAVVTTGLGMLMEESVKGFILGVSILVPIADILATAMTAIMTGVIGSLVIYGIDRLFDWLSSTGTELLQAYEANVQAQANVMERLREWLDLQYRNSRLYGTAALEYQRVRDSYLISSFQLETATLDAGATIASRNAQIDMLSTQIERQKLLADVLKSL
ncbi:hypothetical protein SAMN05216552_10604 [Pseudoduganella namucuonensis]|uniref:Uncharacterized protein n=2 Tax=Pseudoduganella namucuonensis TaxID=1035707 RepID=A0A1I7M5C1_9BURK|nr:hypothetical protein SAMN05216552_10604 [Pseudoduganella namucuonensis]